MKPQKKLKIQKELKKFTKGFIKITAKTLPLGVEPDQIKDKSLS